VVRLFMAPLRHANARCECPFVGVERKWSAQDQNDANDPIATLAAPGGAAFNVRV
jgi:hypothetical protein